MSHIRCIQILEAGNRIEVTTTNETNNSDFAETLFRQQVTINGIHLKLASNRKFMDIVKIPFIKVTTFGAPFELENEYIIQKLKQYGDLHQEEVLMHKYRDTTIYNGIRSINFIRINKPIPTTLFVSGNRLRLKHINQDRTPICGICKTKGHYRGDCPNNRRTKVDYTDNSPSLPETESNMKQEWKDLKEKAEKRRGKREEEEKKQTKKTRESRVGTMPEESRRTREEKVRRKKKKKKKVNRIK